ncbi:MAG: Exodeoxyribonuclease 7 large subunit [Chlamydiia bacterium]|nr:Exodeoxyribonuclease 7 large subunit [Chlamydiia bacterium]
MNTSIKNLHTVSSLTFEIKNLFETNFKYIKVKGEVSNLKKQHSGHIYFTLKDKSSSISVALFAGYANKTLIPKDGDEIIIEGEISVYAPRGSYQIIAKNISKTGTGDLLMKLHLLKEELNKKGYFDKEIKKPLPKFPKKIGVVTSGTGSVIKDIINVLSRRYPNFQLILYPVSVQGAGAELEIAKAINDFNKHHLVDVMIVGRGGGSLEDLFCFNERVVADAIYNSKIPIVSACGHETDFTIADFVADVRAPTPSAAAELVVVDKALVKQALDKQKQTLYQITQARIKQFKTQIEKMAKSRAFVSPYSMLSIFIQNVDNLSMNLDKALIDSITLKKKLLHEKKKSLELLSPETKLKAAKEKIKSLCKHLESINPNNLLKKGYSLIFKKDSKTIINSIKQLKADENITIRFSSGSAVAKIEQLKD